MAGLDALLAIVSSVADRTAPWTLRALGAAIILVAAGVPLLLLTL